jgi:hypothetical protein
MPRRKLAAAESSAVPRDFQASTIIVGGVLTKLVFIDLSGFRIRTSGGKIISSHVTRMSEGTEIRENNFVGLEQCLV